MFPDFIAFMEQFVIPLQQANPDWIRLDGQQTGSSRHHAGSFLHQGQQWDVDEDTRFLPLRLAYDAAVEGEDPFVVEATRSGNGRVCLELTAPLRAQQQAQQLSGAKYLYIYAAD